MKSDTVVQGVLFNKEGSNVNDDNNHNNKDEDKNKKNMMMAGPQRQLGRTQYHENLQRQYRSKKLYVNPDGNVEETTVKKVEKPTLKRTPSVTRSKFYYPDKVEVLDTMESFVQTKVDEMLLETGENARQPQDFLPDLTKANWEEEVKLFRQASEGLSDELLVVLVGDMITEEALPTYQTLLNSFEGCDD